MVCLFCRREIPDGSKYCNHCGRKQERQKYRHPNGSGTVYKRGQTYTAQVRYYVHGTEHSRTRGGFKTKKEAYAYVPTLLDEVRLGKTERIGFCDLWKRVQETERFRKLSDEKKRAWSYAYDKCSLLYPVKDIREIKYEHLQLIVSELTYYPARDVKVLLNAMYQLAMKMELCEKNYAEMIDLPKLEQKREKEVLTDEEIGLLWKCPDRFADYILIMCYCGLRPVEMEKLRLEDIHLDERYMMGGQKTELSKKSRIAIPEVIVPLIRRFEPYKQSKNTFEKKFAKTLELAGITRKLTPGCCRHTFITKLTEAETSTAMIQKAARHAKYQTTLGYTHLPIEDVKQTVNKLDNVIKLPTNCLH